MDTVTLKELEWLHDAILLGAFYRAPGGAGRSIELEIRCPADLGYAPWEQKELRLIAVDVAFMKHTVYGVGGAETVDAIRPNLSTSTLEVIANAKSKGARFPSVEFTICFHSGSEIEICCRQIQLEVK